MLSNIRIAPPVYPVKPTMRTFAMPLKKNLTVRVSLLSHDKYVNIIMISFFIDECKRENYITRGVGSDLIQRRTIPGNIKTYLLSVDRITPKIDGRL